MLHFPTPECAMSDLTDEATKSGGSTQPTIGAVGSVNSATPSNMRCYEEDSNDDVAVDSAYPPYQSMNDEEAFDQDNHNALPTQDDEKIKQLTENLIAMRIENKELEKSCRQMAKGKQNLQFLNEQMERRLVVGKEELDGEVSKPSGKRPWQSGDGVTAAPKEELDGEVDKPFGKRPCESGGCVTSAPTSTVIFEEKEEDVHEECVRMSTGEMLAWLGRERLLRNELMRQVEANNREIELLRAQYAKNVEDLANLKIKLVEMQM